MNNEAKTSIIFVILLLLLSLGATSFYYISYEREKKKGGELEQKLNLAQEEQKKIEQKLKSLSDEKDALESKNKENYDLIAKLNDKLTEELKGKELLKQEQDTLRKKIDEISKEKDSIQISLDQKLKEIETLQKRMDETLSQKTELENKIANSTSVTQIPSMDDAPIKTEDVPESENSLDLEKIVVAPIDAEVVENKIKAKGETERPAVSGEVLLINKEYSFIVINVGAIDGVETGDIFEIHHMGTPLGQVRVEKVHERMSAANLLPGLSLRQVSEGDVANRID